MAGELEAGGYDRGDGGEGAAGQIVDAAAVAAMEVVVVALAGDFVARRLAGDFDDGEPALGDEGVDVAIHGCDADAFDHALRRGEGFIRREGSGGLLKGSADGVFLASFAEPDSHTDLVVFCATRCGRTKTSAMRVRVT